MGSLNQFREGDDPQENASLKDCDKFEEVESDLTFVGICGIKVRSFVRSLNCWFGVVGLAVDLVVFVVFVCVCVFYYRLLLVNELMK